MKNPGRGQEPGVWEQVTVPKHEAGGGDREGDMASVWSTSPEPAQTPSRPRGGFWSAAK